MVSKTISIPDQVHVRLVSLMESMQPRQPTFRITAGRALLVALEFAERYRDLVEPTEWHSQEVQLLREGPKLGRLRYDEMAARDPEGTLRQLAARRKDLELRMSVCKCRLVRLDAMPGKRGPIAKDHLGLPVTVKVNCHVHKWDPLIDALTEKVARLSSGHGDQAREGQTPHSGEA